MCVSFEDGGGRDLLFNERIGGPAVEAEVGVAGCGEGAGVVEEPGGGEG